MREEGGGEEGKVRRGEEGGVHEFVFSLLQWDPLWRTTW